MCPFPWRAGSIGRIILPKKPQGAFYVCICTYIHIFILSSLSIWTWTRWCQARVRYTPFSLGVRAPKTYARPLCVFLGKAKWEEWSSCSSIDQLLRWIIKFKKRMEDEVEIKYKSTRLQLFGKTRRGFSRYKFVSYFLNPTRSRKALFWSLIFFDTSIYPR